MARKPEGILERPATSATPAPEKKAKGPATSGVLKAVTVVKTSWLLAEAYEIEVLICDGQAVIVGTKCLSRAPDTYASAIGVAAAQLWKYVRELTIDGWREVAGASRK